jgi:hypothetical protein
LTRLAADVDLQDHEFVGIGMRLSALYRCDSKLEFSEIIYGDHLGVSYGSGVMLKITEAGCQKKPMNALTRRNPGDINSNHY